MVEKFLDGVHVVVVDDELGPREVYREALAEAGARVTTAASAREALAAIERELPHVLVSDIRMPGEDGYWLIEAVRAVRKDSRRPRTLAITGDPRRNPRTVVCEAGYDVHLGKPVTIETLRVVVGRLAGRFSIT